MTFESIDTWWWPYLFIVIAGWLATDIWRFLGVLVGGKVSVESPAMVLVRCVATALVAAVIANLIIFPGGALALTPVWLRAGSAIAGFAAYLAARKSMVTGIVAAEIALIGGFLLLGLS
jgi:branched-subunit amino acid transport protein